MNKIFSVVINEDSILEIDEFNSVDELFNKLEVIDMIFCDEVNYDINNSIDIESKEECFDYDGGEIEYNRFKEYCEKMNELVSNGDYIVVEYNVEYDNSFLIIKKDDFNKVVELSMNSVE